LVAWKSGVEIEKLRGDVLLFAFCWPQRRPASQTKKNDRLCRKRGFWLENMANVP
jgi:hypothetical protein